MNDDIRIIAENMEDPDLTEIDWVKNHLTELIKERGWESRFRIKNSNQFAFEIVAIPYASNDDMASIFGQITILIFDIHDYNGNVVFWPAPFIYITLYGEKELKNSGQPLYDYDASADRTIIQYLEDFQMKDKEMWKERQRWDNLTK